MYYLNDAAIALLKRTFRSVSYNSLINVWQNSQTLINQINTMADNIENSLTLKSNQGSTTVFRNSTDYTINLDPDVISNATTTEGIIKLGNLFAHELGHAQLAGGFINWDQNI